MIKLLFLFLFFSCAHQNSTLTYDKELTGFHYPYPVKEYSFSSQKQKLTMRYIHEVPAVKNGKTVLLLHGKNFGAWYWKEVIAELLKNGYEVIAPDQIGFGKSSRPENYHFSFQELSINTFHLLKSLGVRQVQVVGHSMGGMLGTRFSLMYPELVLKLVLMNPIGLEDWKVEVPNRSIDELYQGELKVTEDSMREYQRMSYYDGVWKPEYEEYLIPGKGQLKSRDYPLVAWNSALTSEMIFTQPVYYEYSRLQVPTLLLIGTRDRTAIGKDRVSLKEREKLGRYDLLGKKVKKMIPNSKLIELQGIGHMPQVEDFEETMKGVLNFIKE